jgi:peroxisomal enoyl-CoA hydratase 2
MDRSVIGKKTSAFRVRVERQPVANFAAAVLDSSPVYRDPAAAAEAGLPGIPAPPTFSFAMPFWGAYAAEDQPPDPTDGGVNPMHQIMGEQFAKGALVLHGEQEFEYHRPIVVGDVLDGEGVIVDAYEKDTDSALMTFVVVETAWKDASSGAPVVTERFNLIARLRK